VSLFSSLNIAMSGLRAQQYALEVTSHNIANAGTEGYHRQEAVFAPGAYESGGFTTTGVGVPQLGTGVMIQTVRRMQSEYADQQVRTTQQSMGSWSYRDQTLQQVESALNEPGDNGLSASLDDFWNSWEELSSSPENLPAKTSVIQNASALTDRIHTLYGNLFSLQTRTDQGIADNAAKVNSLAHDIAHLDEQIGVSLAGKSAPNDLLDRRDILLEQLSTVVGVQIAGGNGSELMVTIGGKSLIQGASVTEVAVTKGANGWSQIVWSDDSKPLDITGGELAGQMQMRDDLLQNYVDSLNTIAQTIISRVNALHSTGVMKDGTPAGNFFAPGGSASNISVDPALLADASGVATSTTGNSGDNTLVVAIAKVGGETLIDGNTIGGAYSNLVSQIGSQSREASMRTEAYTLTLQQSKTQKEAVSGVSLDEEMLNMVKFQQAYNACARVVTTVDDMIDTMINKMGLVGR
jgi:flagellar hook-associated protein 1